MSYVVPYLRMVAHYCTDYMRLSGRLLHMRHDVTVDDIVAPAGGGGPLLAQRVAPLLLFTPEIFNKKSLFRGLDNRYRLCYPCNSEVETG